MLKAIRQADAERQARLKVEQQARALKAQNVQLRRAVATLMAEKRKGPEQSPG
jgi:hypothetical protein